MTNPMTREDAIRSIVTNEKFAGKSILECAALYDRRLSMVNIDPNQPGRDHRDLLKSQFGLDPAEPFVEYNELIDILERDFEAMLRIVEPNMDVDAMRVAYLTAFNRVDKRNRRPRTTGDETLLELAKSEPAIADVLRR